MTAQTFFDHLRANGLFSPAVPAHIARAPGRLDVLGGIADYSGATVLEMPLAAATWAAAQRRDDRRVVLSTVSRKGDFRDQVEFPLEDWLEGYEAARVRAASGPHRWAAYVAGALTALAREAGAHFSSGVTVLLLSDVPVSAGVSSSAAVEVASMAAISASFGIALDGMQLARLCQLVENRVVAAPCGIMDQVTSALGRSGQLLALKCQPAEIEGYYAPPKGWRFVAIDSAVKHSVGGRAYSRARVAAFMGWRMLREADNALPPGGHLANMTIERLERTVGADFLPESISGRAFLDRFDDWPDPVTQVDPEEDYPVRAATTHPMLENAGVRAARHAMEARDSAGTLRQLVGQEMLSSHARYSQLGLGCDETDTIVDLVMARGPERGLFGARVTGGGSGGAVAILADGSPEAGVALREAVAAYRAVTGRPGRLIEGSSDGCVAFGLQTLSIP